MNQNNLPSTTRFIKYQPSEKTAWLRSEYPSVYLLLSLIAERARRTNGHPDGLIVGDAILDHESAGLTRKQYRTALEKLEEFNIVKIIWNGKNFQNGEKRAFRRAIKSTLVNLIDSEIWDINAEYEGQQIGQQGANKGPTGGHKQEGSNKEGRLNKSIAKEEFALPPVLSGIKADVRIFLDLGIEHGFAFEEKSVAIWRKKYGIEYIISHFYDMLSRNKTPDDLHSWFSVALQKNYVGEKGRIETHREWMKTVKANYNVPWIKINKTDCKFSHEFFNETLKFDLINFKEIVLAKVRALQERAA